MMERYPAGTAQEDMPVSCPMHGLPGEVLRLILSWATDWSAFDPATAGAAAYASTLETDSDETGSDETDSDETDSDEEEEG